MLSGHVSFKCKGLRCSVLMLKPILLESHLTYDITTHTEFQLLIHKTLPMAKVGYNIIYTMIKFSKNPLTSGTLNLQNREMTVIPDDVYKLNDPELLQNLVGSDDDLKWWETEPIAKLYLCSNKIRLLICMILNFCSVIFQITLYTLLIKLLHSFESTTD